jgi:predicted PurR-regulated permease PerM
MLYYLKAVLVPLFVSIIIAIMLFPICIRFEKWGMSRGVSSFLTVFAVSIILGLITYFLFAQIFNFKEQIPQLSQRMSQIIDEIKDFAYRKFSIDKSVMAEQIKDQLAVLQESSGFKLANSFQTISTFLINVFLIPIYIFFLLYYRHFFIEFFYKVFHSSEKSVIDETLDKINVVIKGYLFGQFLDILIIGAANSIALYIIGVDYSAILGFTIAVLCIIPYIGMIAGSILALVVASVTTTTGWQPLTAFIVLWVIHIIDSNIVAPLVIGSRVSINPLMSILMIIMFGQLWGLPGLFLAFPLTAILKVIFDTVPSLKAYGFILGEPEKYHLKPHSLVHIKRLHNLVERKKSKKIAEQLPGEVGPHDLNNP